MRIAVLSDIHGNVFALKAVLDDLRQRGVDLCVNLGDIFYGPIAPKATFDLLRANPFVTICGNQDRQIYDAAPEETAVNPTMRFVINDLGAEPVAWLQALPFDHRLNNDIYMCHGTPADDAVYLLENVVDGSPKLRSDNEIITRLSGETAPVILCGHSHRPRTVQISSGQVIVNPGSVGLPAYSDQRPCPHSMETHSPHAAYAVMGKTGNDRLGWTIDHIKVPYPYEKAVSAVKERGRDDWALFLKTGKTGPAGPQET